MVKLGPPDRVFDGLDLPRSEDRVAALGRLMAIMAVGERRMLESVETSKSEFPPSAQQLVTLWLGLACTSAAVRVLTKMMIEQEKA